MSRYGNSSRHSGDSEGNVWTLVVGALAFLILLGGIVVAVWYNLRNQLPGVVYGVAYDVSQSMSEQEKRRSVGVMGQLIDRIPARERRVKTYRYAEIVREVSDNTPRKSHELNPVYEKMIINHLGEWGTHQSLPLKQFVGFAQESRNAGKPIVLCLLTDGEDHSPQETRKVAEQLAQMDNVKYVVVGPLKESYRLRIQRSLQPLKDAGKLVLFGENDAGRAIEEVRQGLNSN